ncbi:hypothetical protein Avbf_16703 [Armadillidium vulgare]|nr:hypothetical protein Avbf_12632 [Armadillidium vulgare]RXG57627.1 hypothetical protein Avbf_17557 [Armadillidium vulgare]RXG65404.1 hypothetical protein Avbf_16703 [Armadillidium vulgare]
MSREVESSRTIENMGKFKRTWTHQEKERESSQLFQNACVEMQKLPGNEECSKFLVLHPNFKGRNWLHRTSTLSYSELNLFKLT